MVMTKVCLLLSSSFIPLTHVDLSGQLTLVAVLSGRFSETLSSMNISDTIESIAFDSPTIYVVAWESSRNDGSFFTWPHDLQVRSPL